MREREPTETRQMAETDRQKEKAGPYALVVAAVFVLVVLVIIATR
jgi:hypothetical protein